MLQLYLFQDPLWLLTRVLHKLFIIANRDICPTRSNSFFFFSFSLSITFCCCSSRMVLMFNIKKECITVFVHVWLSNYMCSLASLCVFCTLSELRSVFTNFEPLSRARALCISLSRTDCIDYTPA